MTHATKQSRIRPVSWIVRSSLAAGLLATGLLGCEAPPGQAADLTSEQVECGDGRCGVGQACLRHCLGVPPETQPCDSTTTDGPCPVGTARAVCRGGAQSTLGCRPVGRCVAVRAGCDPARPSCGCFADNPCASGACKDENGVFSCPPCA